MEHAGHGANGRSSRKSKSKVDHKARTDAGRTVVEAAFYDVPPFLKSGAWISDNAGPFVDPKMPSAAVAREGSWKAFRRAVIIGPIEAVWQVIRPFDALPTCHPSCSETHIEGGERPAMVGSIRKIKQTDGGQFRERLLSLSDLKHHPDLHAAGPAALGHQHGDHAAPLLADSGHTTSHAPPVSRSANRMRQASSSCCTTHS